MILPNAKADCIVDLPHKRPRLLIVDDHDLLRHALRIYFEVRDGIDVVGEAADGNEAIVQYQQLQPDLVLMDLKMPRMDGVQATQAIIQQHPQACIVVLTSAIDPDVLQTARNAGAIACITKTTQGDELYQAVWKAYRPNPS